LAQEMLTIQTCCLIFPQEERFFEWKCKSNKHLLAADRTCWTNNGEHHKDYRNPARPSCDYRPRQ
jgi:hypothetical protein